MCRARKLCLQAHVVRFQIFSRDTDREEAFEEHFEQENGVFW